MTWLSMEPKVEITAALLNDKAFAFLERFVCEEFTDTTLLFNIEIELAIAGIAFKLEEWLDLIKIIILNLGGMGINTIKAAQELKQAKVALVVPLLEDAATWQLVLCWATDDSLSFGIFLTEMEKFSDRYQFDEWKSIFDQVFEASWEGTAVEVVKAAMAECGIVKPSGNVSHVILSPQAPSLQTCFGSLANHSIRQKLVQIPPLSMPSKVSKNEHEDEEDEEEDKEDKLDNKVDCHPRVTKIAPLGCMNLTQQLKSLFHCYGGEGSAEGSRAKVHQQGPVHNVKDHMEVNTNWTQPRVFKVVLPSGSLKNEITYVQHVKGDSVYILIVPWNLPYISGGENSAVHWELFDMDLAYKHGLEVTLTLSLEGHTIAHCLWSQYHCGLLHGYFRRCNVEPVNLPTPEQIAWFIVSGMDPTLVIHTLTCFSTQRWQVGDHGKIQAGEFVNKVAYVTMDIQGESVIVCLDNPTLELPASLEISIYDFKYVIAGPHHGFEGMVLSVNMIKDMALLCGNDGQQESQGIQIEEHFIEPGDTVWILTGPYRGLTGQVQYFSCSLRQIWVMWHIEKAFNDEDAKGDKGKSKAQVPEVPSEDSDGNGADDEVIIVSLDNVQVTARPTLQFSKKKGWDVLKATYINLITTTLTLESEDVPWNIILDVKYDHLSITPPPPPSETPSVDPGPSNPWVTTPDDINAQRCSEQEQQSIDYGCMSWLFDNNFCNFSNWHVCLRVRLAYNHRTLGKQVVHTTIPDHFFSEKHACLPPTQQGLVSTA
ncbi:hypothetical protein F5J12DRAFT_785839 [Pisolithus orientalis]|uniref:uncharacterized protein n=1 Tax=Pisolithus orientalis TaxID=936130 RepID=UPI002225493B|nr:uncharacterized protein F5J12DRAFT_785839 [Pisolithus orientalis]KAI5994278.1 hypothetical protein F5J12DRAFT_785839 [Pisolithus orientalis]